MVFLTTLPKGFEGSQKAQKAGQSHRKHLKDPLQTTSAGCVQELGGATQPPKAVTMQEPCRRKFRTSGPVGNEGF